MLPMTNDNHNNNINAHVAGDKQVEESDFSSVGYNLENAHVSVPITDDLIKPTPVIIKDSLIHKLRFFKMTKDTETKDQPPTELKKFDESKFKLFKIFKFADKWDILLMIVGSIAVLAANAAFPLMMWLFQSVTNSLIDAGKQQLGVTNSTSSSNQWYCNI